MGKRVGVGERTGGTGALGTSRRAPWACPTPFAGTNRIRFKGFSCEFQEISAGLDRHPRDDGWRVGTGGAEVNEGSGWLEGDGEIHGKLIFLASDGGWGSYMWN